MDRAQRGAGLGSLTRPRCGHAVFALPGLLLLLAAAAAAESCLTAGDLDAATRGSLEGAAAQYFRAAAAGDTAWLRQNSAPAMAADLAAVEAALSARQGDLRGAQAQVRALYLLDAPGDTPIQRAEFFCGIFGASGHTATSASFVLYNLPPGRYALAVQDVRGGKTPLTLSLMLQQAAGQWKLAGFYLRPAEIAGRDAAAFLAQARDFKTRGQTRNAWFYYLTAWSLGAPVDFISTQQLDRISEEMQPLRPADLPTREQPLELASGGRSFRLTDMFAVPVEDGLDLVVKYPVASIADRRRADQDNHAVIGALLARYPELRDAFQGVVARAVEPGGTDFGTLVAMKDVK